MSKFTDFFEKSINWKNNRDVPIMEPVIRCVSYIVGEKNASIKSNGTLLCDKLLAEHKEKQPHGTNMLRPSHC